MNRRQVFTAAAAGVVATAIPACAAAAERVGVSGQRPLTAENLPAQFARFYRETACARCGHSTRNFVCFPLGRATRSGFAVCVPCGALAINEYEATLPARDVLRASVGGAARPVKERW